MLTVIKKFEDGDGGQRLRVRDFGMLKWAV